MWQTGHRIKRLACRVAEGWELGPGYDECVWLGDLHVRLLLAVDDV